MAAASKRKKAEIGKMEKDLEGVAVERVDVDPDKNKWVFSIAGPAPYYTGRKFTLRVDIPDNYPFKAPDFSFDPAATPYHPSVTWEAKEGMEKGQLCPAALGLQDWKPPTMIAAVIKQIIQMLTAPKDFTGQALSPEIAAELTEKEGDFKAKAATSGV